MANTKKWDDLYVHAVEEFMAKGYSITAFAGEIGVTKTTIYDWSRARPEFGLALDRGRAKRALFWEGTLIALATGTCKGEKASAIAAIFALKNVAPDEFRDRIVHEGGDPDKPIALIADEVDLARTIGFMLAKAAAKPGLMPVVIEGAASERDDQRDSA